MVPIKYAVLQNTQNKLSISGESFFCLCFLLMDKSYGIDL